MKFDIFSYLPHFTRVCLSHVFICMANVAADYLCDYYGLNSLSFRIRIIIPFARGRMTCVYF